MLLLLMALPVATSAWVSSFPRLYVPTNVTNPMFSDDLKVERPHWRSQLLSLCGALGPPRLRWLQCSAKRDETHLWIISIASTERAFAAVHDSGAVSAWGDSDYGGSGAPSSATSHTSRIVSIASNFLAFAAVRERMAPSARGAIRSTVAPHRRA